MPKFPVPKTTQLSTSLHHTGLKVTNITDSMLFYSLLGWDEATRFYAGPARAVWLKSTNSSEYLHASVLELIEVPMMVRQSRGVDLANPENIGVTGLNHFAINVTVEARARGGLVEFLDGLQRRSIQLLRRNISVQLEPQQRLIGQQVVEICFIADPDGALVELISFTKIIERPMDSAW